jgi:heme exporter protein C
MAAILCLVGLINLPIVHFSVDWWSTLHQPASILRAEGPSIHGDMLIPLFVLVGAYFFLFSALLMANMRASIYRRRVEAARLRGQA